MLAAFVPSSPSYSCSPLCHSRHIFKLVVVAAALVCWGVLVCLITLAFVARPIAAAAPDISGAKFQSRSSWPSSSSSSGLHIFICCRLRYLHRLRCLQRRQRHRHRMCVRSSSASVGVAVIVDVTLVCRRTSPSLCCLRLRRRLRLRLRRRRPQRFSIIQTKYEKVKLSRKSSQCRQ